MAELALIATGGNLAQKAEKANFLPGKVDSGVPELGRLCVLEFGQLCILELLDD